MKLKYNKTVIIRLFIIVVKVTIQFNFTDIKLEIKTIAKIQKKHINHNFIFSTLKVNHDRGGSETRPQRRQNTTEVEMPRLYFCD